VALPARQGRCAADNSSAAATKNLSLLSGVFINEPVRSETGSRLNILIFF
jgi:hypothetical protein